MTRILLTGANGFIGRQIACSLVEQGHDVIAVSRAGVAPVPGMQTLAMDVLDEAQHTKIASVKADILIHSAWITTHGVYWTSPENAHWEAATLALAKAFMAAGGKRIVGIGTCVEYDLTDNEPLDEITSRLAPHTPYGQAKLRTWMALKALADDANIAAVWCRLFHLYGPAEGRERLVPAVILPLLRGEEARTSPGTQIRDFLSSTEAGRAIAHVALSGAIGPVNIGSGQPITIAALVTMLADMLGRRNLLRLGAIPLRSDDPAVIVPKTERLAATGFTLKADLVSGLSGAIAYWKHENLLENEART